MWFNGGMAFRLDPSPTDLPAVGDGYADIAVRTHCGRAAAYDGSHPEALAGFVGDDSLRVIDGVLYRKDGGAFVPVTIAKGATVVFVPAAGDWRFITPDQLAQEFAVCVPTAIVGADAPMVVRKVVRKAAVKKAAPVPK